jgi:hypothetical protein
MKSVSRGPGMAEATSQGNKDPSGPRAKTDRRLASSFISGVFSCSLPPELFYQYQELQLSRGMPWPYPLGRMQVCHVCVVCSWNQKLADVSNPTGILASKAVPISDIMLDIGLPLALSLSG